MTVREMKAQEVAMKVIRKESLFLLTCGTLRILKIGRLRAKEFGI